MSTRRVVPVLLVLLVACGQPTQADMPLMLVGPFGTSNGRAGVVVSVQGADDLDPLEIELVTWPERAAVDATFSLTYELGAIRYVLDAPEMLEARWYAALVRSRRPEMPVSPTGAEVLPDGHYVYPFFGGSRPRIHLLTVSTVGTVQDLYVRFTEPVSAPDGIASVIHARVNGTDCVPYGEGPWNGDDHDFDCGTTPPTRVELEILVPIPARDGDGVLEPRTIVLDPYEGVYSDPLE